MPLTTRRQLIKAVWEILVDGSGEPIQADDLIQSQG
jgi:hypothetical protein